MLDNNSELREFVDNRKNQYRYGAWLYRGFKINKWLRHFCITPAESELTSSMAEMFLTTGLCTIRGHTVVGTEFRQKVKCIRVDPGVSLIGVKRLIDDFYRMQNAELN